MTTASIGIAELHDEREIGNLLCMDLIGYIADEAKRYGDTEGVIWEIRHAQARSGQCAYRAQCNRYLITSKSKSKEVWKKNHSVRKSIVCSGRM